MPNQPFTFVSRAARAAVCGAAVLLAACGGGNSDNVDPIGSCSVADQQDWLRDYMRDQYFWYAISPNPSPSSYGTVGDYFEALLYTGTQAPFPADRWSFTESTASFNMFYGDGQSLGYGISVAGVEVSGRPDLPLYVRYVEPLSPAASAGVVRGDQIVAVNGRPASELIAAGDYSVLTPGSTGQTVTLQTRNVDGDRTVTVAAAVFSLSPLAKSGVIASASGRPLGYVLVKDMIDQATAPLDAAFAQFKAAGVQELVIDLRYNGGGLVSVANTIGSYAVGNRAGGQAFASLLFNDKQAKQNTTFPLATLTQSLGVARVYVLTGSRTCSASELVINGLRPFTDVVTIGDTTCGKPVGFVPQAYCDTTYNVVNFESVNANNEGRYFNGFDARCPVGEDYAQPLGSPAEPLLAEALQYADSGSCSAGALAAKDRAKAQRALGLPAPRRSAIDLHEPGERGGMVVR